MIITEGDLFPHRGRAVNEYSAPERGKNLEIQYIYEINKLNVYLLRDRMVGRIL